MPQRYKHRPLELILRGGALVVVVLLWIYTSGQTAFFWSLFVMWATFRWDSRIVGAGALVLLILIPITLSFADWSWVAEQLAVYVFFLLCITVGLQMIELWREPRDTDMSLVKQTREALEETYVEPVRNMRAPRHEKARIQRVADTARSIDGIASQSPTRSSQRAHIRKPRTHPAMNTNVIDLHEE